MPRINGVSVKLYELAPEGETTVKEKKAVKIHRYCPSIQKKQLASGTANSSRADSLVRFGPVYGTDQQQFISDAKDKAWERVRLFRSGEIEIYLAAVRRVEEEAKNAYSSAITAEVKMTEFRIMMIRDSCFLLQLAFLILGRYKILHGYQEDHRLFGRKQSRRKINKWIESIFFVGNQIPLVVLKELIKEEFFQDKIAEENWSDMPPSALCKKVLYEQLFEPGLEKLRQHDSHCGFLVWKRAKNQVEEQQPLDLLHALHNMVLGPVPHVRFCEDEEEEEDNFDLEANEEYQDDDNINGNQETTSSPSTADNCSIKSLLSKIASRNANEDQSKRVFPSASELKQSGIRIRKLQNGGIRSIDFKNYFFLAFLYLPVLQVDDTTEIIFRNLKMYESSQPLRKHKREVTSYLKLMSDLIQTPEDVRLLKDDGIIQGRFEYAEPEIFSRLSSDYSASLTQELRNLRSKIANYSSPWIHYRRILDLVVVLALLQTLFTVLAYFRPPK